jgi:hypothetical protein
VPLVAGEGDGKAVCTEILPFVLRKSGKDLAGLYPLL